VQKDLDITCRCFSKMTRRRVVIWVPKFASFCRRGLRYLGAEVCVIMQWGLNDYMGNGFTAGALAGAGVGFYSGGLPGLAIGAGIGGAGGVLGGWLFHSLCSK
jgi:hypothetical protein